MKDIAEITQMEHHLNDASTAIREFADALERLQTAQIWIRELERYYGSDAWYRHREADDEGLLPKDLRRGVLSEDGIYTLLADNHSVAIAMLKTAADILE